MTGDSKGNDAKEQAQREAIRALFRDLPTSYTGRSLAMRRLREIFGQEMAEAIRPSINAWAAQMPIATTDDRVRLAAHIGHAMHMLGLALAGPRTGEPADLAVQTDPRRPGPGLFRFQERAGRRRASLSATAELPELVPMDDPPQVESLDRWLRLSAPDQRGK